MTKPTTQLPDAGLQRRQWLGSTVVAAPLGLILLGGAGCQKAPSIDRQLSFKTLDEALA